MSTNLSNITQNHTYRTFPFLSTFSLYNCLAHSAHWVRQGYITDVKGTLVDC